MVMVNMAIISSITGHYPVRPPCANCAGYGLKELFYNRNIIGKSHRPCALWGLGYTRDRLRALTVRPSLKKAQRWRYG